MYTIYLYLNHDSKKHTSHSCLVSDISISIHGRFVHIYMRVHTITLELLPYPPTYYNISGLGSVGAIPLSISLSLGPPPTLGRYYALRQQKQSIAHQYTVE